MARGIAGLATGSEVVVECGPQIPPRRGAFYGAGDPAPNEARAMGSDIRFGPFRLLPKERCLERNGETVPLGGRALDILAALVSRAGEVVTKAELSEAAWPGMIVEEGSLRFHIASLRKALGERAQGGSYLITVAGRGYCFTAGLAPPEMPAMDAIVRPVDGTRLPPALRRMIGTGNSIADAAAELVARRFLTLVGPPGIGKTTLAVRLGHQLAESFADGVAFVDFGSVSGSHLVSNTVAAAIGGLPPSEQALETMLAVLRDKHMLLIFDGCEHLVDAVAELAERLFRQLPMLSILATSRESLRVEGEHVYRLFPLACPSEERGVKAASALAYSAVELFVDRVQASQVGYVLSDEDAPFVSEICRKLDGIPLALELAAGRVTSYGIRQTASLLDGRFRLLWKGRRTAPPRHQTLSAALDWSYDLLSPAERLVLRRVSVFVGLFTLEGVKAVVSDDDMSPDTIVAILADLVTKSLVVLEEDDCGAKYRLLDTTRVYALTKLFATEEAVEIGRRHAIYMRDPALFLELSLASESLPSANERGGMLEARLQAAHGLALLALGIHGEEVETMFRRGFEIAGGRRRSPSGPAFIARPSYAADPAQRLHLPAQDRPEDAAGCERTQQSLRAGDGRGDARHFEPGAPTRDQHTTGHRSSQSHQVALARAFWFRGHPRLAILSNQRIGTGFDE